MGVVHPTKLKRKLACILEADESTRMRMEIRYRITMKTILQEKVKIHYSTTTWFTNLFPMPQAMKIPAAKAAVDKEWAKLEKISAWNLTKV